MRKFHRLARSLIGQSGRASFHRLCSNQPLKPGAPRRHNGSPVPPSGEKLLFSTSPGETAHVSRSASRTRSRMAATHLRVSHARSIAPPRGFQRAARVVAQSPFLNIAHRNRYPGQRSAFLPTSRQHSSCLTSIGSNSMRSKLHTNHSSGLTVHSTRTLPRVAAELLHSSRFLVSTHRPVRGRAG